MERGPLRTVGGLAAAGLMAALVLNADNALAQPAAAGPASAPVQINTVGANLNVSPKRVTFDRAGSATVYVFNQGTAAATFDVQMVDRVMMPDGQIVPVSDLETRPELKPLIDRLKSAKEMLVATPRRATLAPGKGQTIRIRAAASVAGAALPPGEYRTHLTVVSIPPRDIGLTAEQAAAANPSELRFQINSVFGISIPVIMRMGPPDIRAAIENPKISVQNISPDGGTSPPRPTPVLSFQLARLGPSSLFGNLEVHSAKDKPSELMGLLRGVGVYPEIDRREVQIALKRPPVAGEQIDISFKDDDTAPGRLVAKTTFTNP